MCGIFGILGGGPVRGAVLRGLSKSLRHRGPDDEGFLIAGPGGTLVLGGADTPAEVAASGLAYAPRGRVDPEETYQAGVVLGHRRLSIIDLSPGGHQPMCRGSRHWIVFNGEVYNHPELRAELEALGHHFETGSDTEVVLASYAQWGPGCLARFNGMWALAIVDMERGTLFLARDRFGVKPLYYAHVGGSLVFASEVKAFAELPAWKARANLPRLLDFLVWNVLDHTAETMFDGVRQLPAGHYIQCDLRPALRQDAAKTTLGTEPVRWYEPAHRDAGPRPAEQLREALTDAVRLRLRADVPVGSCLSGGIDSSSIVCLMSEQLGAQGAGAQLRTFTARSAEAAFDEGRYAALVAQAARSQATYVTPDVRRLFEDLSRLIWHQDEPFVSSSIFAQWCVFDAARKAGVIVMLDGQGADETYCGYRGFFGAYLAGLLRQGRIGQWALEAAAIRREIGFSWPRTLGYTAAYLVPGMLGLVGKFDGRAYADRGWLRKEHRRSFSEDPVREAGGRRASVREMSLAQVTRTNLPMLLHWEDRNSMAFSVEARVPFLDYRVVELALSLDDAEKVGGGISKAVVRKAMRGLVPDEILDRRDKMGFLTAEPVWMRGDQAKAFRAELAAAMEALPGLLDPSLLARFDETVAGTRPFDQRYWRAMSTGRWASLFSVSL